MQLVPGPFQQPTPGVDLLTWMQESIDSFLPVAVALLPLARNVGFSFACIRLIKTFVDGAVHALVGRPIMIPIDVAFCIGRIAFINFVISYWVNPIPGLGVSFPDIFLKAGKEIASVISMASLDMLLNQLNTCWQGLEHPPMWNWVGLGVYYLVLLSMCLLDGMLFFITFLGFFAVALGKVFGSILAVFYLLPGYESKFHSMVNFLWNYSMYRATAAAWVFVVSTFMVHLFQSVVGSDFSLGHMSAIFVILGAAVLASVFGAFKVPHFNSELFGGGATAGDFGNSVRNLLVVMARRGGMAA